MSPRRCDLFGFKAERGPRLGSIRFPVHNVADKGWDVVDGVILHVEPARAARSYGYMWKRPMFGQRDIEGILKENEARAAANPGRHVRVSAVDRVRQIMGFSRVVQRA